ncbi:SusC/RagA family TonB-linked outer membrane protein [Pinibacter aurantiacus]|uniref:SusC/RagA family TonB-linked outer membrane protein n=1 Tax=Pinibacter aurantiacus TaxID=2851599 RepID=A0A9E2SEA3_9BACT|nr:SusC/RagA family TonB-linked outer membrane protein [Pinibacter aurantiacus]MBV4360522.1 SusC/RagA family TonB-linked outer membrane protein [Pinibacter aurantiacus]
MKFTAILMVVFTFAASAHSYSQISISAKNKSLSAVFKSIKQQSGYDFVYAVELLEKAGKVSVELRNVKLQDALEVCLRDKDLTYTIVGKTVVIKASAKLAIPIPEPSLPPTIDVQGRIVSESGEPVAGASIKIKGSNLGASADKNGLFQIKGINQDAVLIVSGANIETIELKANQSSLLKDGMLTIKTRLKVNSLDETVVIAYGTTTRRLTTGSISKVKGEDIRKHPVDNPFLALSGKVPGMQIAQTSGVAGAPVSIYVRGKSSLGAGSEPLYVIDGVPFAHTVGNVTYSSGISAQTLGGLSNATAGSSPFVNLNPSDIESIEVLKDADATAIYGSRGANGVILITTRKAKAGKTAVDLNFYTGWGRPTKLPEMMNTQQYTTMRREAFKNDSIAPNTTNATDLMIWDTTRNTDWKDLLLGQTARNYDGQVRVSGGNQQTQVSLATGYHRETPVYYGNMHDDRINMHSSFAHRTLDNKFSIAFNASYSSDKNNLSTIDLMQLLTTIPNAPYPLDANGNLVWSDKGVNFSNPLAYTKKQYIGLTDNMLSSLNLSYTVAKGLRVKLDGGFNIVRLDQTATNPIASQSPSSTSLVSSADFYKQTQKNWILEPQMDYTTKISKGQLQVLIGGSFQEQLSTGEKVSASGYTNDALLLTPGPAATKSVTSSYSKYRYDAFFGRISYNWDTRYLINISGRRDGSSRFGPGKQFGNFGAIGAGWIFSNENFMKSFPALSYGKLRGSIGVTGNDRIGNYQYISQWLSTSSGVPYQGSSGLYPYNLDNPDFAWERNRKMEAGLELGFFKDRIDFTADYYLNRTDNQLVGLPLPSQVGFTSVNANRDAILQNSGWEFALNSTIIKTKNFSWRSSFNISIPRNKLIAYPNLENTSYATIWSIGQPVTIQKYVKYLGVDPTTGIYQLNGINLAKDKIVTKNLAPMYYGGFQNTLAYKGWTLDFTFYYVKQSGKANFLFQAPGTRANQPVAVLDRWQQKGDITNVQRFTTTGAAATQYSYWANYSDAVITNTSFVRLKNVSLAYQLDKKIAQKIKADNVRLFFQGENLLTFTPYKIGDPEIMSFSTMPPLRMMTVGLQVVF